MTVSNISETYVNDDSKSMSMSHTHKDVRVCTGDLSFFGSNSYHIFTTFPRNNEELMNIAYDGHCIVFMFCNKTISANQAFIGFLLHILEMQILLF